LFRRNDSHFNKVSLQAAIADEVPEKVKPISINLSLT
jgi:hypothetical protein